MKLYLVRHGQSTGNIGGTLMGQSDHPLTALGEDQARAAAEQARALRPHARVLQRPAAGAGDRRARRRRLGLRRRDRRAAGSSSTHVCARSRSATTRGVPGRSSRPTRRSRPRSRKPGTGTALPNGESLEHLEAQGPRRRPRHPRPLRRGRHRSLLRQRREPGRRERGGPQRERRGEQGGR